MLTLQQPERAPSVGDGPLRSYQGHPAYRCAGCGRQLPADPNAVVVVAGSGGDARRFEPTCVAMADDTRAVPRGPYAASVDLTEDAAAAPTGKVRLGVTIGLPGYSALRVDVEDAPRGDERLEELVARLHVALWGAVEGESRALDRIRRDAADRR